MRNDVGCVVLSGPGTQEGNKQNGSREEPFPDKKSTSWLCILALIDQKYMILIVKEVGELWTKFKTYS